MWRLVPVLLGTLALLPVSGYAQSPPALYAAYDTYAAGFDVARVEAAFDIDRASYEIRLAYHTTGLVGFFYRGHQLNTVQGRWNADQPAPHEFYGSGAWGGEDRLTIIDYQNGQPLIRRLTPPQEAEREPVPSVLQQNSVDTLSALAMLIRRVAETGRCEAVVHTFDGRRASEISAHTGGMDLLPSTGRSSFAGTALRCDFVGQMLAGFRLDDSDPADRKPLQGAAWFSPMIAGAPPVPVRMRFQTRWFGEATMYLTEATTRPSTQIAGH